MPFLSVYNNLIQGHVMMRQTRFDTHKRSELKEIYQRIRRMNVDQPFYKVDFDDDTQKYTLGVKDRALELTSSLKELSTDDDSNVFKQKAVISTRPDDVEAETTDGFNREDFDELEINVLKLSEAQTNSGRMLSTGDVNLQPGQYGFTVGIEDNYFAFQFNVSEGSSNRELQTKLSDFINKTKIGLSARVVAERGMSRIDLAMKARGTQNADGVAFRFEDTKRPDNAFFGIVEHFGLNHITQKASNTQFTVNGTEIVTAGREYVLNNGLKLNFSDTTPKDEPAIVKLVVDDRPVVDKIVGFAEKYNSFIDFVKGGFAKIKASGKLLYEMGSTIDRYKDVLSENGINPGDDGRLVIDTGRMTEAIRDGRLEKVFGSDSPVTLGLMKRFSDVTINPMDYIDKKIITYPNTSVKQPYSPYVTSVYSGLMYNNYC